MYTLRALTGQSRDSSWLPVEGGSTENAMTWAFYNMIWHSNKALQVYLKWTWMKWMIFAYICLGIHVLTHSALWKLQSELHCSSYNAESEDLIIKIQVLNCFDLWLIFWIMANVWNDQMLFIVIKFLVVFQLSCYNADHRYRWKSH